MKWKRFLSITCCAVLAAATFWGCASGGGISGTSVVFGPISGFGSIIVGEVTFDISQATISIEGDPAEEVDLRLGMVVLVKGRVAKDGVTGTADRIAADHILLGTVQGVNTVDGTFTALSQLVITDAATVFDQVTLPTLAAGDKVEVFGFLDADGGIRATRVERVASVDEIELTGIVSDLDTTAMTFSIGLLSVDYGSALIEDADMLGLDNGSFVEIETDQEPVADLFLATGVEIRDPNFLADIGDTAEIQGFVTQLLAVDEFVVNTIQRVRVTPETVFEGGTLNDIMLNTSVEVDGKFDSGGVLVATEVEIDVL